MREKNFIPKVWKSYLKHNFFSFCRFVSMGSAWRWSPLGNGEGKDTLLYMYICSYASG